MKRFMLPLFLCLMIPSGLTAVPINIAVVAIHGEERAIQEWTPTVRFLQQTLPLHTFKLLPYPPKNVDRLKQDISANKIDFVISQPAIYVELELSNGISRILTMIDKSHSAEFGSVLIAHSDSGIERIEQAKDRRFAAVAPLGFGGWLIGYHELLKHGIDPVESSSVTFVGTQKKVVDAVLSKSADIGVIRTGILEKMLRDNPLHVNKITVINRKANPGFPYLLSTDLFPEWAFAKTKNVSNSLAKEVAQNMMYIPPQSDAAKKAGYREWTTPYSYQPVHELMQKLRVGPYEEFGKVTVREFIGQYKVSSTLAALFLFSLIVFIFLSHRMKHKLQNYIDIVDGITISSQTDTEGKILYASEAFCRLTGYTKEELIGKHHSILRHNDTPKKLYAKMWATLRAGKVWRGEIQNVAKDGTAYWVDATISPVYDASNRLTGYTAIRQDITDKKKIEKQRILLMQQSRLAQMGELIGMIAHQWRQPLNIMGLSITRIETEKMLGTLDDATFESIMKKMNAQVNYMSQTIDDFKGFFQQDRELQETNLHALVQESIDLLKELFKSSDITISNEVDDHLLVRVSPNELKQVTLNILNNAKDALLEQHPEVKAIRISAGQNDAETSISIVDNGSGIAPDIIDKVFDPYFTTKFESQGTGLGLYIAKLIIKEHMQGTITAENSPEGTCITIRLPRGK